MRAIGPSLSPEESQAFIKACRDQVNVKFRHQGRNPKIGFDCAGLVLWGLWKIGRSVSDIEAYGREPHKNGLRDAIVANLGSPVDSMESGDVVLMRFDGEPRHVGVLFHHPQGLSIVHTYSTVKRVTEHILDAYWRSCICEIFRP